MGGVGVTVCRDAEERNEASGWGDCAASAGEGRDREWRWTSRSLRRPHNEVTE